MEAHGQTSSYALSEKVRPNSAITMSDITRNKLEEINLTFKIANCLDFSRLTAAEMKDKYNLTFSLGKSLGCESQWKVFLERKNHFMVPVFEMISSETTSIFDARGEMKAILYSSNGKFGDCHFQFDLEADKEQYKPYTFCNLSLIGVSVPGEMDLTFSIKTVTTDKQLEKEEWEEKFDNKLKLDLEKLRGKVDMDHSYLRIIDEVGYEFNIAIHDPILYGRCPQLYKKLHDARVREGVLLYFYRIHGISSKGALRSFVSYLYNGKIHDCWKNHFVDLYELAHRYAVVELSDFINDNLMDACTPSTCADAWKMVKKYGLTNKKQEVFRFCFFNIPDFYKTV